MSGVVWPSLNCPECGGGARSVHGEGGRQYELDPPKPYRYWLEPCGHGVTKTFFDAFVERFRSANS